jgi:sulfatase maturation enzyme AslB (radical SAM superfamily)
MQDDVCMCVECIHKPLLVHTVNSFISLEEFLFTEVSEGFVKQQDPVEKFFGQQRQRGRTNENSNARDNTQALRVINGVCRKLRKFQREQGHIVGPI